MLENQRSEPESPCPPRPPSLAHPTTVPWNSLMSVRLPPCSMCRVVECPHSWVQPHKAPYQLLPGLAASGFLESSDEWVLSTLGRLALFFMAFCSLFDMAGTFLGQTGLLKRQYAQTVETLNVTMVNENRDQDSTGCGHVCWHLCGSKKEVGG